MTILNSSTTAEKGFLSAYEVDSIAFLDRISFFEQKYQAQFQGGWSEFYLAYTTGQVDGSNLDYDEWAFLCEHFMKELTESWRPPGFCVDSQERPETNSGLSFAGRIIECLTRRSISLMWSERLTNGIITVMKLA